MIADQFDPRRALAVLFVLSPVALPFTQQLPASPCRWPPICMAAPAPVTIGRSPASRGGRIGKGTAPVRIVLELSLILVLLGVNAVLAASETAIISLRKTRLRPLADEGNRAAKRILQINEAPGEFLATIQIGITLAGFFAAAVGAVSMVEEADSLLSKVGVGLVADHSGFLGLVVVTILVAFLSIIVGELAPKTIALEHAEAIALRVVRPLDVLAKLTRPVVRLLTAASNVILGLVGSEGRSSFPSVTRGELLAILETAEDEGVVEGDAATLAEEALEFGEIQVRSVMVPRVDVVSLDATATLGAAVDVFFETGFSRLPVYREQPDNVLGILHIKDVFRLTWQGPDTALRPVGEFVRPVVVVPETKQIDDLLHELRALRTHIAVVADEYGGMAGIVTLEDLLEELVGEISDEFDPGYEPVRTVEPGVHDVDGRLSLLDLLDVLDLDRDEVAETDVESVGGLIADALGRIPETGDVVEHLPLRLEVREMDGYRVALARVTRVHADDASAEGETPPTGDGI